MTASDSSAPEPVLILGGGLMGLAVAHQLARRGIPVTVLSRRRSEAAGFVAAGMLAPHAEGLAGALLQLGQLSLSRIPSWVAQIEADSGLPCGLRSTGIVVPFHSVNERDAYPTAPFGEPLNREQLVQELPGINAAWSAGLLFAQDGQIDNRRQLMRALESACVDRGVQFQEGVEVLELFTANDHLSGVRTRDSEGREATLRCERAVLCSGAWSGQLLTQLPVFPVKGQMLSLQSPRGALRRVIFGPGIYLVPREDGLWWSAPPANAMPASEKDSLHKGKPLSSKELPPCYPKLRTGLPWSAGGDSVPVHLMKARCWATVRSQGFCWPAATIATAFSWLVPLQN